MDRDEGARFCQDWLAAWTGNQPERLIGFYSDDAYYQDPARPLGLKGRSSILIYFRKLLAANPNWRWQMTELIATENGFVLKWRAEIPRPLKTVSVEGLDIVEVEGGTIRRNEVYFDTAPLLLHSP